jgi:hypothetical protein
MVHPIIGLWQVDVDYEGRRTHVTHTFLADGILQLHAAEHGASLLWEATGARTFRIRGTRPIEPQIFRFIGWQYADGEGEVSDDGLAYTLRETTHVPQADGSRVRRNATLHGRRFDFESPGPEPSE